MNEHNLESAINSYLECALWSSIDDNCYPLDGDYSIDDCSDSLKVSAKNDILDFFELCQEAGLIGEYIERVGMVWGAQFGHDFWLTRNGHGAGFWDRGFGKLGGELTRLAKSYGTVDLYVTFTGEVTGE